MLKVGIYVDYKHNETTLAAVMLANWMVYLGHEVKIISNGKIARNVDSYWDSKVIRYSYKNRFCFLDLTHVLWFYPDRLSFFTAKFLGENNNRASTLHLHAENSKKSTTISNLYFPGWCDRSALSDELILNCNKVMCLSRDMALWLSSTCRKFELEQRWCDLTSSDKLLTPKYGKVAENKTKMLVILGSDFVADIGAQALKILDKLLKENPTFQITLLYEKSLPRQYRSHIRSLIKRYPKRVVDAGIMPYSQYQPMSYLHDWTYIACASFKTGALIPHLEVSGTPLICHDIPPARSYISGQLSGLLIPTESADTFRPRGLVSFTALYDTLKAAINMNELAIKGLQQNSYANRKKRGIDFARFLVQEIS